MGHGLAQRSAWHGTPGLGTMLAPFKAFGLALQGRGVCRAALSNLACENGQSLRAASCGRRHLDTFVRRNKSKPMAPHPDDSYLAAPSPDYKNFSTDASFPAAGVPIYPLDQPHLILIPSHRIPFQLALLSPRSTPLDLAPGAPGSLHPVSRNASDRNHGSVSHESAPEFVPAIHRMSTTAFQPNRSCGMLEETAGCQPGQHVPDAGCSKEARPRAAPGSSPSDGAGDPPTRFARPGKVTRVAVFLAARLQRRREHRPPIGQDTCAQWAASPVPGVSRERRQH